MKRLLKILKYTSLAILGLLVALFAAGYYLYATADLMEPALRHDSTDIAAHRLADGSRSLGANRLQHSDNGFWEIWLEGNAEERGTAFGALADSLLYVQEVTFVEQIRHFVPNEHYLGFLRYLTLIFNRNLAQHIPEEFRTEIAAIARHCTHEFDFIGTPYQRQLNYHAAHDIGHAMQQYMLVGCTAFGAWGEAADGGMIIGRNFDFYVGDDFARNRLLTFCAPDKGYRFVSIGWAGMVGVLSGMNERGLTVTLNAAKGAIPLSSATPVSILAREILQYASTIDEAYAIASKSELFVSESFLVGSALDNRCAVIEKSPEKQALYWVEGDRIGCTNHFQSDTFADERVNRENIALSDSKPRLDRLNQLLRHESVLTLEKGIAILRDRYSQDSIDLGLANPLAINQQIAHHSVLFEPIQLKMWVSTGAWGYDGWACYNVGAILSREKPFEGELYESRLTLPADSVFMREELPRLLRYREILGEPTAQNVDSLRLLNPLNWEAYDFAGRYYESHGEPQAAWEQFTAALARPMPEGERIELRKKLK